MEDKGWIKLYRQIQDSAIWNADEPFDKRSAWIDMMLTANHEDRELFSYGRLTVQRGQMFTSIRKLAVKWSWSVERVMKFLNMLKEAGMIYVDTGHNGTLITIVKYDNFQSGANTKRTSPRTSSEH